MTPIQIEKKDRILVLSPHPDDESIGAGGLLVTYPSQCSVIVVTDGGKSDVAVGQEEMKKKRKEEFASAMKTAGVVDYSMLDFPDGELSDYPNALSEIDFSKYTKVFLPNQAEKHPDHMSVFSYALDELIKVGMRAPEIFMYETRGAMEQSNYFLDISDVIDSKMKMIYSYRSQIMLFDHAAFAESINHYHACKTGRSKGYYEAYEKFVPQKDVKKSINNREARIIARCRREIDIYYRWIGLKNEGGTISRYLIERGWKTAGVYGYGEVGQKLVQEMISDDYNLLFVMDRNKNVIDGCPVEIYLPSEQTISVDVVIITVLSGYESIKTELHNNGHKKVMHLVEILSMMETEKRTKHEMV